VGASLAAFLLRRCGAAPSEMGAEIRALFPPNHSARGKRLGETLLIPPQSKSRVTPGRITVMRLLSKESESRRKLSTMLAELQALAGRAGVSSKAVEGALQVLTELRGMSLKLTSPVLGQRSCNTCNASEKVLSMLPPVALASIPLEESHEQPTASNSCGKASILMGFEPPVRSEPDVDSLLKEVSARRRAIEELAYQLSEADSGPDASTAAAIAEGTRRKLREFYAHVDALSDAPLPDLVVAAQRAEPVLLQVEWVLREAIAASCAAEMLSSLFRLSQQPSAQQLHSVLLEEASLPLRQELHRWLLNGEAREDGCLIRQVPRAETKTSAEWWGEAHELGSLPCFISKEVGKAVLEAGRAVSFIRVRCGGAWEPSGVLSAQLKDPPPLVGLGNLANSVRRAASAALLEHLYESHDLRQHIAAMWLFSLGSDASFHSNLCRELQDWLTLPLRVAEEQRYLVSNAVVSALKKTPAAMRLDVKNVLPGILVETLTPTGKNGTASDAFVLGYQIGSSPVGAVLPPQFLRDEIHPLAALLWRVRRLRSDLVATQTELGRVTKYAPRARASRRRVLSTAWWAGIERATFSGRELFHRLGSFISGVLGYLLTDGVGAVWCSLAAAVDSAKDLDAVMHTLKSHVRDLSAHFLREPSIHNVSQQLTLALDQVHSALLRGAALRLLTAEGVKALREDISPEVGEELGARAMQLQREIQEVRRQHSEAVGELVSLIDGAGRGTVSSGGVRYLERLRTAIDFNLYHLDAARRPQAAY